MYQTLLLAIPVHLVDEGPEGVLSFLGMFFLGLIVLIVGIFLEDTDSLCILGVMLKKLGIALTLTGLFSALISFF